MMAPSRMVLKATKSLIYALFWPESSLGSLYSYSADKGTLLLGLALGVQDGQRLAALRPLEPHLDLVDTGRGI